MKKLKYKILLCFLITSSAFLILSGAYSIYNLSHLNQKQASALKSTLYSDYDKLIKSETETAASIINTYYKAFEDGKISEKVAQDSAKRAVRALRYNGDGYFWIDDTDGILIAHAITPKEEGTNRIDLKDPNGVALIKNIIKVAQNNNSGYTNYMWAKPNSSDSNKLFPKRVYSQLFKPWNWIISTGNYVDDINKVVDNKRTELNNNLYTDVFATLGFLVASLIGLCIAGLVLSKKISSPITALVNAFGRDENGQIRLQEIEVKSKDEIGMLGNTLNELAKQVKDFLNNAKESAVDLSQLAKAQDKLVGNVESSTEETTNKSSSISQNMKFLSQSSSEITCSIDEIDKAMASISKIAEDGATSSSEVSIKAKKLKNYSMESRKKTENLYNNTKGEVEVSITEVKKVESMLSLLAEIRKISDQTNILALNASIESARAGEAGRGFSVVAEDIRELAEHTNMTVNEIQTIVTNVVGSVDALVGKIQGLLQFIDDDVLVNYDDMVNAAEQYYINAEHISKIMSELSATTEEVNASTSDVANRAQEVSDKIAESTDNLGKIIEHTINILSQMKEMKKNSAVNSENASKLKHQISRFKI